MAKTIISNTINENDVDIVWINGLNNRCIYRKFDEQNGFLYYALGEYKNGTIRRISPYVENVFFDSKTGLVGFVDNLTTFTKISFYCDLNGNIISPVINEFLDKQEFLDFSSNLDEYLFEAYDKYKKIISAKTEAAMECKLLNKNK